MHSIFYIVSDKYAILQLLSSEIIYDWNAKNYLYLATKEDELKVCLRNWEFIVFSEQFLRKGVAKVSFLSSSYFGLLLEFLLLLVESSINLNAFLIQYFTIYSFVFLSFWNLRIKVLKINSKFFCPSKRYLPLSIR